MITKKKIIITGAGGFIGSYLVKYFNNRDYDVTALVRNIPKNQIDGVKYKKYFLGGCINNQDFVGVDIVIHCAFIKYSKKNPNANEQNYQGTKDLYFFCWQHNIKKFIFLSSLSSHEKAKSQYGKSKFRTEKLIDTKNNNVIIRPGLVMGEGGFYKSIENFIQNSKFVPLIDGGKQMTYITEIDALAEKLYHICENNIHGNFVIAQKTLVSIRQLNIQIAKKLGKKPIFIFVPFLFAYIILKLIDKIGINLSISVENLLGLKQSVSFVDEKSFYEKDIN